MAYNKYLNEFVEIIKNFELVQTIYDPEDEEEHTEYYSFMDFMNKVNEIAQKLKEEINSLSVNRNQHQYSNYLMQVENKLREFIFLESNLDNNFIDCEIENLYDKICEDSALLKDLSIVMNDSILAYRNDVYELQSKFLLLTKTKYVEYIRDYSNSYNLINKKENVIEQFDISDENTSQIERMAWIIYLDILKHLEEKYPQIKGNQNLAATLINTFTGIKSETLQKNINDYKTSLNNAKGSFKNNPITEKRINKMKQTLINLGLINPKSTS
ncbi:MAG: hypothetical protein R2821_03890 [Flavobacteriaceae bacterium]